MPATGRGEAGRRLRVVFMGTPEIAVPTLEAVGRSHQLALVVTQPDRRAGRGRRTILSPVKSWALAARVPVHQPPTLREPGAYRPILEARPDVAVVVAYGLILPAEVLAAPPLGCINLHASLLPRHRGASPIQATILEGDAVTGVTTMRMDEGLDTGPILLQERVPVRADDTAGTLASRLGEAGADLMLRTLRGLAGGTVAAVAQDPARATLTRRIRKEDGLIDWTQPAVAIERRVRAMQPWPSAYTWCGDTRLQVWSAEVLDGTAADAAPGTVVSTERGPTAACGGGSLLRLRELQRPGGRRLPAEELVRGFPLAPGDLLDGPPGPA